MIPSSIYAHEHRDKLTLHLHVITYPNGCASTTIIVTKVLIFTIILHPKTPQAFLYIQAIR